MPPQKNLCVKISFFSEILYIFDYLWSITYTEFDFQIYKFLAKIWTVNDLMTIFLAVLVWVNNILSHSIFSFNFYSCLCYLFAAILFREKHIECTLAHYHCEDSNKKKKVADFAGLCTFPRGFETCMMLCSPSGQNTITNRVKFR